MKPPLIFFIVLAVIAVLATRQFIKQRREVAVNDASPVKSLPVEVKAKREVPVSNRRSRQREAIPVEEMRYEAWFHPLNGAGDFKLVLEARDYHQIDKGERGELRVKGTRFVSFSARTSAAQSASPAR
ncbi:DUF2500 domain-containing protein [Erwinia oleae]|uniref:DUF2500 domain-containing protein n=1 Tax=Erwinia oleae TaxID=796334 RepID=UPI00068A4E8B|nr:DUF2500 domain-containing protein [Erwinia oleae]